MRLALGASAATSGQVAFGLILLHAGVIPPSVAFAILVGAAVIALCTPLRARVARELASAERAAAEIEEDRAP